MSAVVEVVVMIRKMSLPLILVALAVAAWAADGVNFSYRFQPGAAERHRVKVNTEADFGGMAMSQVADLEVSVKCVSAAEGRNVMQLTVDKADMSRTMFGNMEKDPTGEMLVGHAISFVVDGHGKVDEVAPVGYFEGWDQIKRFIDPVIKNWYVHLPGEVVAVGGEWTHDPPKETDESGVEVTSHSVYKFKEMKKDKGRDLAQVSVDVENTMGGKSTTPAGVYDVDGKGKGKYEFSFDPATGAVAKFKGSIDVDMNLTPQTGGDPVATVMGYTIERELL